MRGDKSHNLCSGSHVQGSPPHARGQASMCHSGCPPDGITPACAGTRCSWPSWVPCSRDHPRMRGDKSQNAFVMYCMGGSPPHARGQEEVHILAYKQSRITPACAGTRAW